MKIGVKMSKKTKLTLIISGSVVLVALLVTLFLVLFLPKGDNKITLATPSFLNIQVQDGTKYLITDKNDFASKYAFYIYEGDEDPDNLYDYIKYETENFYLDVTEIFVNAKNYHFYCKYVGNDKYNDSFCTEVKTHANKYQLSTPQITINGTQLSWLFIENASSYGVYANGRLITTDNNNYTVENNVNYYDIFNYVEYSTTIDYEFYVVAFGDENYNDSKYSNVVTYKNIQQLPKVNETSLNWNQKILSWNKVNNAYGYEIIINNSLSYQSETTSYDFSNIVTDTGKITFKIKALGTGNYSDSEYTSLIEKTFEKQLASPINIAHVVDSENIYISWDSVEDCNSYSVYINNVLVEEAVTNLGIVLQKANYSGKLSVQIQANGHGYYLSSAKTSYTINLG